MKTIVIGLGNPILSDDGVGWKVAQKVSDQLSVTSDQSPIDVEYASLGGLSLMERMVGFERAILIDALESGQGDALSELSKRPVGSVWVIPLEELPNPSAGHSASAHDASLLTALETGRQMGLPLPEEVHVVAIEAKQVYDFSEELSPAVAAAVPLAVQAVFEILATEKEPV